MMCLEHIVYSFTASGTGAADTTNTNALGGDGRSYSEPFRFDPYGSFDCQVESGAPSGSPTTPTSDVKLQGSLDGTNWYDLLTFTQTTTSASTEQKSYLADASNHGARYLRMSAAVGTASGTATYVYTVTIDARRR